VIIGEGIRLRAIEKSDLPNFTRWLNDPEVRCHLEINTPLSMGQEETWYKDVLTQPLAAQPLGIEIETDDGWLLIGNIGFRNINHRNRSAEVGIFIGEKDYWNHGYGSAAMRLMLKHGFENFNYHRIYLNVLETNPRGIRSYQKVGFTEEGRLRDDCYLEGRYVDVLMMGILRNEWQERMKGDKA